MSDRRLLLVHAHPDDETIGTGATMAKYVDEGAHVTLITCTAGEMGEILIPELEHLSARRDGGLGERRRQELAEAMVVLGVTDHRFLGGFGRYHDSDMKWDDTGHATAADDVPANAFWHADLTEAATDLVAVIRDLRPQVLLTYDEFGNYGHPDHIQAHRVATYAVALAAAASYRPDLGDAWDVAKVYWLTMSASAMRQGIEAMRAAGDLGFMADLDPENLPRFAVEDDLISTRIDGSAWASRKVDAMRAHSTQMAADGPFFALSDELAEQAWGPEYFRIVKGTAVAAEGSVWEDDLFAGL